MKIIEIIKAYWNYLMKPKNKQLQEERLKVCTPCEFNSSQGKINMLSHCNNCGCILKVKANCIKCKCPENKWKK